MNIWNDIHQSWIEAATNGWICSVTGDTENALQWYLRADELAKTGGEIWGASSMEPELSLLRHKIGEASGLVRCPPPSEDLVISITWASRAEESLSAYKKNTPTFENLEENLARYTYDAGFHLENIKKELPHIQILSTGRCGTVSLYRLFEQSQYIPYHSYFYNSSYTDKFEMMTRHMFGNYNERPEDNWTSTRAAEWLGAISQDRPMIGMNHLDTVYAPAFSQIHPKSKFIYLHRDPEKVFNSFYTKKQWNSEQLCPLYTSFPFEWKRVGYDLPESIAWYIRFTEEFSKTFGKVMDDRFLTLSSDKLFDQDQNEIDRLIEFTDLDLTQEQVTDHFSHVYNEKAHKVTPMEEGLAAFKKSYAEM